MKGFLKKTTAIYMTLATVLTFLTWSIYPYKAEAAIGVVAHTCAAGGVSGATTSSVNTTGASLIVLAISWYRLGGTVTVSDNQSNSYTMLTIKDSIEADSELLYKASPTTSSSHTFTISTTNGFANICVIALSGTETSSPFDQENGAIQNGGNATIQVGSVTPSQNNEIVITGVAFNSGDTSSIDSSFTISDHSAYGGGVKEGIGMAYIIQTTAGAVNPTWTLTGNASKAATIATFKAAAAAPTGPVHKFVFKDQHSFILNGKNKYIFQ